jgi:hypothetical protein
MIAALVRAAGGVPFSAGIARDDRRALMYSLDTNLGHADLFLVTGGASAGTRDLIPSVVGNLGEMSFGEAYGRLVRANERFHADKLAHLSGGAFEDTDFFPCWYCSNYFKKVDWLKTFKGHPWLESIWEARGARGT